MRYGLNPRISMEKNRFKEALLEKKEYIYTLELVPGRGSRGIDID
jgi:hypothetical protein